MKKSTTGKAKRFLSFMILFVLCIAGYDYFPSFAESNGISSSQQIVKGTIVSYLATSRVDGEPFLIISLNDRKKYRLTPEHGLGYGVGDDVVLIIDIDGRGGLQDEISRLYPDVIPVKSVKILATVLPGTNKKVKYPVTVPPVVIEEEGRDLREERGTVITK